MIASENDAREFVTQRAANADSALNKLDRLAEMLVQENQRQNLISKSSEDLLWLRHFADSAQLLDYVPRVTSDPWFDLGSGAGLPGIVVAILEPSQPVVLIESRKKRAGWLTMAIEQLDIPNCRVEGSRLELVATERAGVVSARAFAPLPKLLRLSARFSTKETHWVLPKGRSAAQELAQLPRPQRNLFHVEQSVTDVEAGILVGKGRVTIAP